MELRGNLRDFGLPDIVQLVSFGRKTGALRLDCDTGEAVLYFEEGRVVHAEYPGREGEGAAYLLFQIPDGSFRFESGVASPRRTLSIDPTNLVMEAMRRLDEAEARKGCEREGAWVPDLGSDFGDDWSLELRTARDPTVVKQEIRDLLARTFGKNAKRLVQAIDQCGDTEEELVGLAERLEKYIHVFLDSRSSRAIGDEVRALISREIL